MGFFSYWISDIGGDIRDTRAYRAFISDAIYYEMWASLDDLSVTWASLDDPCCTFPDLACIPAAPPLISSALACLHHRISSSVFLSLMSSATRSEIVLLCFLPWRELFCCRRLVLLLYAINNCPCFSSCSVLITLVFLQHQINSAGLLYVFGWSLSTAVLTSFAIGSLFAAVEALLHLLVA